MVDVYLVFDEEGNLVEVKFRRAGGRCREYMARVAQALKEGGVEVEVKDYVPEPEEAEVREVRARRRLRAAAGP